MWNPLIAVAAGGAVGAAGRRLCSVRWTLKAVAPFLLAAPLVGQDLDEARELHIAGRLREALTAYRAVIAAAEEGDTATLGTAHNNACVVLNSLGDFAGARDECRRALALRRQLGEARALSRTLNNTGLALQGSGDYPAAERHFREALRLNLERDDVAAVAVNRANLGVVATLAGRYGEALAEHRAVAELAAAHMDAPWADAQLGLSQLNQGVVLERLGAFREALALYRRAETHDIGLQRRATLRLNIGVIYRNLGDPLTAVRAFEDAAVTYRQIGDESGLSNALLDIGLTRHLNLDRPTDAEAAYREALEIARRGDDAAVESQALYALGVLALDRDDLEAAQDRFDATLAVARANGSVEGRWSAHSGLGRTASAAGDLAAASSHLETAIEAIETTRRGLASGDHRGTFFASQRGVFAAAIDVEVARAGGDRKGPHVEAALALVQRAKARQLLEALGRTIEPLDADALRAAVGRRRLLELFVADTVVHRFLVSADAVTLLTPAPLATLRTEVAEVTERLAAGRPASGEALEQLARLLLPADTGGGGLLVSPDGPLYHLPFELLPVPADPVRRLIEATAVSYLPSGSILAGLPAGSPPAAASVLGVGDPALPPGTEDAPLGLVIERFRLEPLTAAASELAGLERYLPGRKQLLRGKEATEEAFRAAAANGARVLHLATHAVIDERRGGGGAIVLTPDAGQDGLLRPQEIASAEMPFDVAVLAACRTALGADGATGSDALTTLTGAFLSAGSASVVATLWDVDDAATAVFMEQLYHRLGRGEKIGEALRQAKLRLLADPAWSDPSIWAAYVLVGDPDRRVAKPRWRRAGPLMLGFVGVLALVATLIRARTRRA